MHNIRQSDGDSAVLSHRPSATASSSVTGVLQSIRQIDWSIVALVLLTKVLLFIYGAFSYVVLADRSLDQGLGIWNRWDAPHYLDLAREGYSASGETRLFIVFYPLYPWLIRAATLVSGSYFAGALLVSTVASIASGVLLYRLALVDYSPALGRQAVWFLLIFPTSYFLHIGYTESLFIALVIGSFLAARRERWLLAGVIGALAALTRTNGLMLIPALCVEAFLQYRQTRRWNWHWLAIGMVGLGFGGYLLLNWYATGNPVAFLAIQHEHWFKSLAWPWSGIMATIRNGATRPPAEMAMVTIQELFFIALGVIATVFCWLRLRPSYSMWMTSNMLLFTSTSFILSTPRYMLTLFPLFLICARLARHPRWNTLITVWSLLFLALFVSLFVQGRWAF